MIYVIQKWQLPDMAIRLKEVTVILLGSLSAYLVIHFLETENMQPSLGVLFIPLFYISVWLFKKGLSSLTCVLFSAGLVYLLSLFWGWI